MIKEYREEFELIVIEVKRGGKDVRVMTGYGPHKKKLGTRRKGAIFRTLEQEIIKAKLHGKLIYIQMDANSKLGPEIIFGDPQKQSENGKILAGIVKRHALIVMNS